MKRSIVSVVLLVLVVACGKKGPPQPPPLVPPVTVRGLQVVQRGDQLVVRFEIPATYPDGAPFTLDNLRVEMLLEPKPRELSPEPAPATVEDEGGLPVPVAAGLARHDGDGSQRPRLGTTVPDLASARGAISRGRLGNQARFLDGGETLLALAGDEIDAVRSEDEVLLTVPAPEQRDQHALLRVIVGGQRPRAPVGTSNVATVALAETVPAPSPPVVENRPRGLTVTVVADDTQQLAVFRVDEHGRPLALTPAITLERERTWVDVAVDDGGSACFALAEVVGTGPGRRYSRLSEPRCGVRRDVFAPGPPERPRAFPSREGLLIVWSVPAEGSDVTGYNLYRAVVTKSGAFVLLNEKPLTERRYLDADVEPGLVYAYEVTAVDDATPANESARSMRLIETAARP